ncbi:uncharacterized protein LOC119768913 [Culex quinquefasciatus]|uniref:uncharacterized protein LOC119768913 n=1 Tax=Culex quinquefasciatus TaxID=7176 RepID=UPI0018E32444|nr:uncharacterized protein LOC119768913 [Culex quinquefasciatus]
MPKRGARHGNSSAPPGTSRNPSPGRITKNNLANSQIKPSTAATALEGIDKTKLHPHYRSPYQLRFEPLSGDDEDNEDDCSTSSSDDDDDPARGSKKAETSKTAAKERRPPPIFVVDTLADHVDELLEGQTYCLKIGKKNVQVITLLRANYDKVLMVLKTNNVKYFTFDPAETVPVKIVLQGYTDRPVEDLAGHLADVNVHPRDIKVLSRTTTVTGTHVLYLLYFDRGTVKLQDLRRKKTLDGFWVTWRYFSRNSTDAAQCHRCQKFGHGSRNYNLPPRCVKCGEMHFTEKCKLPQKARLSESDAQQHRSRVKCANCDGNHTANFRGCAARKAYLEEQAKKKKKLPATQPPPRLSPTVPVAGQGAADRITPAIPPGWGGSYASVTAASGTVPEQAAVSGDDLFTLPEFFALAGEMLTRFRACRNKAEQFMALGELMIKYVYNG